MILPHTVFLYMNVRGMKSVRTYYYSKNSKKGGMETEKMFRYRELNEFNEVSDYKECLEDRKVESCRKDYLLLKISVIY